MWVRSQDKEMLMNCNAVGIGIEDDKSIYSNGYVLGTYSTKEKALKVLDTIECKLNGNLGILKINNDNSYEEIQVPEVFQMPSDSDVEL